MTDDKEKKISKRQFTGLVVKTAMQNTVLVRVDRVKIHPRYQKRYTVSKKYPCDCRIEGIKVGDKVLFVETRPLSKTKRWRVLNKI